jgi:hypothetical protein
MRQLHILRRIRRTFLASLAKRCNLGVWQNSLERSPLWLRLSYIAYAPGFEGNADHTVSYTAHERRRRSSSVQKTGRLARPLRSTFFSGISTSPSSLLLMRLAFSLVLITGLAHLEHASASQFGLQYVLGLFSSQAPSNNSIQPILGCSGYIRPFHVN